MRALPTDLTLPASTACLSHKSYPTPVPYAPLPQTLLYLNPLGALPTDLTLPLYTARHSHRPYPTFIHCALSPNTLPYYFHSLRALPSLRPFPTSIHCASTARPQY